MANQSREQLEQAIASITAQRAVLGEAVVEATLAALRQQLAELAAPEAEEQRKLVSLLFADLVGFNALSQNLDPEELRALQQAYFKAVTKPILEEGGWVEKYIGDAILAVFGLPQAAENDPDRAARAALGIQAALRALNQTPSLAPNLPLLAELKMRIGIHTGQVVVSGGRESNFVVTGEAVNLASRLQSAAPEGGILVSPDTYRHLRGAFDLQELAPLSLKGKAEPVQVYRLSAARPRSFRTRKRGVEGVETRMVGRDFELQALQNAFFSMVEDHERCMLTITGEPGLGKSRLLYEFENWVDLRPEKGRLFHGRARLETQQIPYGLLKDLFAFQFAVQDDDPLEVVWQKFEAGWQELETATAAEPSQAHFIGELLGYDFSRSPFIQEAAGDARQVHDRAVLYLIEFFKWACQDQPALILLEDLHWADDSSLDFIHSLALALHDRPLMLVGAARPTLYERRPNWMEGLDFHHRLDLHPLSKRQSRQLVEEVLQKVPEIPERLREMIITNAEGNPFYLEELIKMLIEEGVIEKGEPTWRVALERLEAARIPQTLTGVLQARLDSLPEAERLLLQQASVSGRIFWDRLVAHLNQPDLPEPDCTLIESQLLALRQKEMVYKREHSTFAGAHEHIFKHALLQEVTYETVLKRLRRVYHLRAAEWLKGQSSERAGELLGMIALHLEKAGEQAQALAMLVRAGDEAAGRYANQEAVQFYTRGLELTVEGDAPGRCEILLKREHLYDILSQRQAQEADLHALQELLERGGEAGRESLTPALAAEIQLRKASFTLEMGYLTQAEALAAQAFETATRVEQPSLAAFAAVIEANAAYRQGKFDTAQAHAQKGLEIARQAGDLKNQRMLLNSLGMIAQEIMDWEAGRRYLEESLEIARQIGDWRGEATGRCNLAMLWGSLGQLTIAREEFLRALQIIRQIGDRAGEAINLSNLGWLEGMWGNYAQATAYCQENLEIASEVGDRLGQMSALVNLSAFQSRQGDHPAALETIERGLKLAHELSSAPWIAWGLTYRGHALAGLGREAQAKAAYQEAVKIRLELEQPALASEPLAGLARLALAGGDLAEALNCVEPILAHLEGGMTLEGTDEPRRVLLTCAQVLKAAGDERWQGVLAQARQSLQALADTAPDKATRLRLLEIPWNRAILHMAEES